MSQKRNQAQENQLLSPSQALQDARRLNLEDHHRVKGHLGRKHLLRKLKRLT